MEWLIDTEGNNEKKSYLLSILNYEPHELSVTEKHVSEVWNICPASYDQMHVIFFSSNLMI